MNWFLGRGGGTLVLVLSCVLTVLGAGVVLGLLLAVVAYVVSAGRRRARPAVAEAAPTPPAGSTQPADQPGPQPGQPRGEPGEAAADRVDPALEPVEVAGRPDHAGPEAAGTATRIGAAIVKAFISPGAMAMSRGSSISPGTSDPTLTVTVCVSSS